MYSTFKQASPTNVIFFLLEGSVSNFRPMRIPLISFGRRENDHAKAGRSQRMQENPQGLFLVFGAKTVYRRTQNQLIGTKEPTTRERPEEAKVKEKSRMERDKAVQCKRDQATKTM